MLKITIPQQEHLSLQKLKEIESKIQCLRLQLTNVNPIEILKTVGNFYKDNKWCQEFQVLVFRINLLNVFRCLQQMLQL